MEYLGRNENKTYKSQMFNRWQSTKVFKDVVAKDSPVCVIRNSELYVAILKYESYIDLIKKAKKYDELEEKKNALWCCVRNIEKMLKQLFALFIKFMPQF